MESMIFTRTLLIVGWKIWYQYYPPFFYDIYYFYLSINTLLICNHPNSQPTHKTQWVTVLSTQANFQPNIINVKDTVFNFQPTSRGSTMWSLFLIKGMYLRALYGKDSLILDEITPKKYMLL